MLDDMSVDMFKGTLNNLSDVVNSMLDEILNGMWNDMCNDMLVAC